MYVFLYISYAYASCMYLYIYVYHIYLYIFIYAGLYVCIFICTYMYVFVYIYINTYMYIYTYIHVHKHMFVFMYVRAPVCVCVCVYVYVFNARKHVLLVHPVHPPNKFFTMIQSNAHSKDFLREYTPLLRRKEPSTTMSQYNAESVSLIYKTPYKIDLFCGNIDIIYGGGRPLFRHKPCLHPIHAQQKYCQPNRALWRHFRHYLQRRKPIILSRTLSTSDPTLQKLTLAHVRHEQQGTHAPRLLVRS